MNIDEVKTTVVVGAGEVGHGIALGLAMAGYQIRLNSTTEASLQKGLDSIKADLDRLVDLVHRSPHLVSFFPHGFEPACQLAISDQGLAWS